MVKGFKCELCGKEFNAKAHLKQHLNKKYKCSMNIASELDSCSIVENNDYVNIIAELKKRDEEFTEYKKKYKKLESEHNFLIKQYKKISEIITMTNLFIKNDPTPSNQLSCENI